MSTNEDTQVKCPHCSYEFELNMDNWEDGDVVCCDNCGEDCHVWCNALVDADTYHENYCDSQAAARYEDAAYGDDREHYIESSGRSRGDREDFHSDG
jgi:hypothetical protein